jgi:predicted nicotinamide N-methyase
MKTDHTWIDKWAGCLRNKTVLELGCGQGIDTACISAVSKKVTATDLKPYDKSKVMQLDHSNKFPFDDGSFDVMHGRTKRSYEKQEIEEIFSYPWELLSLEHKEIDRYEKLKYVWEFGAIIGS